MNIITIFLVSIVAATKEHRRLRFIDSMTSAAGSAGSAGPARFASADGGGAHAQFMKALIAHV